MARILMVQPAISVAAFLPRSLANGPGVRSVLWVQGCPLRCEGCFNEDFQEFDGRNLYAPEEIAEWILQVPETEGVTFSGGEPFAHAAGLSIVADIVKKAGKSVVIFTGYTRQELCSDEDEDRQALLRAADMLIAGRYENDKPCIHPLLSSANQEIVHLTDRYQDYDAGNGMKRTEFRIDTSGTTVITGLPGRSIRNRFFYHKGG